MSRYSRIGKIFAVMSGKGGVGEKSRISRLSGVAHSSARPYKNCGRRLSGATRKFSFSICLQAQEIYP